MTAAITPGQFHLAMQKIGVDGVRPKIAVAVSGGGDSLALALLMREWIASRGGEMLALTVDHRLREGSGAEAEAVQKLMWDRGIAHEILSWQGGRPETHVQELARQARYRLLLQACKQRGFFVLAVAHNIEDQVETFWMRLAHGSGLDGLAAMAPLRVVDGVSIIRPLLAFPREQLRAACAAHEAVWLEDPSNRNEKYLRVRLRPFEALLASEGLSPQRLAQTLQKLEDSRDALEAVAAQAVSACVQLHPEGYARLKMPDWQSLPRDIQRRVLAKMIARVSPQIYPVGFDALEQTRLELHTAAFAGRTLAGCEFFPGRGGEMLIVREENVVEKRAPVAEGLLWDWRFITSGFSGEPVDIGALGEAGLSELRKKAGAPAQLEALPYKVKRVLPALWRDENLLAVPHAGYYAPSSPQSLRSGRISLVKAG